MTLLRGHKTHGIEETPVSGFFCRILKGDIISGMKCQDTIYQEHGSEKIGLL